MIVKNRFTMLINSKGKRIVDFTDYWNIDVRTYRRWCADETKHDRLLKMINGMSEDEK
jgi:hypothetical protein